MEGDRLRKWAADSQIDVLDEINRVTREAIATVAFEKALDELFGTDDYDYYPPADSPTPEYWPDEVVE